MKRFIWIMILGLLLVACATNSTPAPTEVPTSIPTATSIPEATATPTLIPPTETATEIPPPTTTATEAVFDPLPNYPDEGYGPVGFPENINPLTGLPVDDPTILNRRPVAVKISNELRNIRPQWGLSQADHVFEYYHEYGESRYHAVFYGNNVSEAGPIRSARFPDEHLIRAYKSVFAFGSADSRVLRLFYNSDFGNRIATVSDIPCPPNTTYPTCRIEPNQWNHLMTDTSILSQHFTEAGVPNGRQYLDGLHFNKSTPANGETGTSLTVRFSKSHYQKWEFDPINSRYFRYDDASTDQGEGETYQQTIDRTNSQPVAADNVVVLLAPHKFYSREPEIVQINLIGFGKAYVFRDGQTYLVNWAHTSENEIISLTYDDGSRFPLKPGNTWFEIVGQTSPVVEGSPNWRFQFQTP